jgi:tellurite methyltransferase
MSQSDLERWNAKYAGKSVPDGVFPDEWLTRHVAGLVPRDAIELACGLGHNAIWLAQRGWNVDAVDVSPVGLKLAAELAHRAGCSTVNWIAADLDTFEPCRERCDLIVVFRFLDRVHLPQWIATSLRPGGILIYETFSRRQMSRPDNHLKSADFTLAPGELPTLFPELTVIAFEETDLPDRCVARLVARKPDSFRDLV